jgi:hypothetical protein
MQAGTRTRTRTRTETLTYRARFKGYQLVRWWSWRIAPVYKFLAFRAQMQTGPNLLSRRPENGVLPKHVLV